MAKKYDSQLAVLSFEKDRAKAASRPTTPVGSPQLFVDDVNNVCSACQTVRCPDGCCCAC